MNTKTGKKQLRCGQCGATGVRLYRPYQTFYKPENNRCNGCLGEKERDWFVPCVQDDDGSIWGLTSVPNAEGAAFHALPEGSADHPSWPWGKDWDETRGKSGTLICSYKTGDNTEKEQFKILTQLMDGACRQYPRRKFVGASVARHAVTITLSKQRKHACQKSRSHE